MLNSVKLNADYVEFIIFATFMFNLILFFMVHFRIEVTDHAGFVVFDETYCSYSNAKKCFDEHLSFCDSINFVVLMTAYLVREDLDHSDLYDLPF